MGENFASGEVARLRKRAQRGASRKGKRENKRLALKEEEKGDICLRIISFLYTAGSSKVPFNPRMKVEFDPDFDHSRVDRILSVVSLCLVQE